MKGEIGGRGLGGGSLRLRCRLGGAPEQRLALGEVTTGREGPALVQPHNHFLSGSSLGQQLEAVSLPKRESERSSFMATIDSYKIMEISIHSTTIY